jgi:hypothetical protein
MRRKKIWVSLGTAVLAASPAAGAAAPVGGKADAAVAAQARHDDLLILAQAKGHGDEGMKGHGGDAVKAQQDTAVSGGGEGDEGGGSGNALPAPLRLYRGIELIRGHLLIGNELVEAGRWAEAMPHFLHPGEEIYGGIRDDLKTYNIAPFQAALKALAQTVKAKNKEAYGRARAAVEERMAAAETSVRGKEANIPTFTLETILEVLQQAAEEYEGAFKDGRLANIVEYQDARGFIYESDRLFGTVAEALSARNADAVKTIRTQLAELKDVFPTAMPPQAAVKDPGQVLSSVSRIELQLGNLQ